MRLQKSEPSEYQINCDSAPAHSAQLIQYTTKDGAPTSMITRYGYM
jgi:hypothetical protein